ncbi:MAG: serine hydrolase [Myxococcota bacterium]|nr:serine hydrolase [Myxococcota bacterium]
MKVASFQITQRMRTAVQMGVAPAIALGVTSSQGQPQTWYEGRLRHDPDSEACDENTIFDLASLTKPLTTTMAALTKIADGTLDWETEIGSILPVASDRLARCPVWRLMNHTAGLPAHRRYYEGLGKASLHQKSYADARAMVHRMVLNTALECAPGSREIYSDLSYLALSQCLRSAGFDLQTQWSSLPLHSDDQLHFRALETPLSSGTYAATEHCPWRGRELVGEVHDDNCWTIGGIGGHAGLFGTLDTVLEFGRMWLKTLRGQSTDCPIPGEIMRRSVSWRWMHARGTRVLGWDSPTPGRSSAGRHLSRSAIGHLGYTGTSIWIDPVHDCVIVLLTNRVCPDRSDIRIRQLRPKLHNLTFEWFKQCMR